MGGCLGAVGASSGPHISEGSLEPGVLPGLGECGCAHHPPHPHLFPLEGSTGKKKKFTSEGLKPLLAEAARKWAAGGTTSAPQPGSLGHNGWWQQGEREGVWSLGPTEEGKRL